MPSFSIMGAVRSFWHTMTSNDRHASHNSPYRTGQHMPLNQSRHAPLTSVATSAIESRADLNAEDTSAQFTPALPNGNVPRPGTPGSARMGSPAAPYSPGMRSSLAAQRTLSNESNPFDKVSPGEIQMQNFQEGQPPPPPVQHSWKKIDRWAEENYEELYDQLSEGATQNDVNELEHDLDISLPMEVRESLQTHDGQERGGRPTGILFSCMLLDCEEIVQEWRNWKVVNEEYLTPAGKNKLAFAANQGINGAASSSSFSSQQSSNPLWRQQLLDRQESQPPRAIQRAYAHPSWIPLARDWGGNNLAVDLAPGPSGKWGQVIIFGRDYDCKYVVARSWSAFLANVADDLNSGKWFVDEETQELKLREFKTQNVEPAYLDILRWRMDQKHGRRGPRRRPTGQNPGSPGHSSVGSPYGSPTEERGRSPQRFPARNSQERASVSGAGIGKPSPLGILSEERKLPKLDTATEGQSGLAKYNNQAKDQDADLVELMTDSVSNDKSKQEDVGHAEGAASPDRASNLAKTPVTKVAGLGVEGVDDLKNVAL